MKACLWGTRGSLPASVRVENVEKKIKLALEQALAQGLKAGDDVDAFIRTLGFDVRGSYGCNTSCVEIRSGSSSSSTWVVCDSGSGLRDFGNHIMRSGPGPKTIHLLQSHIHWDHIHGFPFFVPAFIPGNTIHIWGCHKDLEKAFVNQQEPMCFPLRLSEMRAKIEFHVMDVSQSYEIADFAVKIIKQNHPGDSYGYRFEQAGKSIVYSTDSEHEADAYEDGYRFLPFFQGADLVVFDAQYNLAEHFHTKANWGHSSNMMGVELAVRAGVKRLCLFHNEHTIDDHQLEKFLKDTRRYLEIHDASSQLRIDLAYDGLELEV